MPSLWREDLWGGPLDRSGGVQRKDTLTLLSSCLPSVPYPTRSLRTKGAYCWVHPGQPPGHRAGQGEGCGSGAANRS